MRKVLVKARSHKLCWWLLALALFAYGCGKNQPETAETPPVRPTSYEQLIALSDDDLAQVDVARMNLLCAEGLAGAEDLDVQAALWKLDRWARLAKASEEKYLPQFWANQARYDHSLAKFKAVNLALTIKEDLGCGYNLELVRSGVMSDVRSTRFFQNSKDLFLHGFLSEQQAGSCASLPVLMVALGRRLDYPVYLVACKGHLFCRWDDGKERFNIETAMQGVDSKPDSYYYRWPHPTNEAEAQAEGYLTNLTPRQELAVFAQLRAACLQENRDYAGAADAYEIALATFPDSSLIKQYLNRAKSKI
ncbi:hypothetical protein H5P28_11445 [Ruficoccus amylovorans]|uniref:Protein SirB1 N-terminal domain-containing protein n=1 Tax=Ruficoccus amylovorans TaxID=1804625 RepID=A0A842HEC7_9BACT|nr:hypothetical protein [Ruficoccus amylovorans]MBC2594873.1 hypothetical protein [Ruficoccus amylovorans]